MGIKKTEAGTMYMYNTKYTMDTEKAYPLRTIMSAAWVFETPSAGCIHDRDHGSVKRSRPMNHGQAAQGRINSSNPLGLFLQPLKDPAIPAPQLQDKGVGTDPFENKVNLRLQILPDPWWGYLVD